VGVPVGGDGRVAVAVSLDDEVDRFEGEAETIPFPMLEIKTMTSKSAGKTCERVWCDMDISLVEISLICPHHPAF
jgi:hypothetical protein